MKNKKIMSNKKEKNFNNIKSRLNKIYQDSIEEIKKIEKERDKKIIKILRSIENREINKIQKDIKE